MVAAFIDSSENMTLGISPLQKAAASPSGSSKAAAEAQKASGSEKTHRGLFGPEGFTFSSFLDIINPLQHIPVVNTIYRAVTGDTIENGSRLAGGALFGGPIGFLASVFNGIVDEETGNDLGGHALAALGLKDAAAKNSTTGLAQNAPPLVIELADSQIPATTEPGAQNAAMASSDEVPLGALSNLTNRAWGETAPATIPNGNASRATIPYRNQKAELPGQNGQANAAIPVTMAAPPQPAPEAAPADERKWFPANTQKGGLVTRSVGAQPVTPNSVAQKFGVSRGSSHAATPPAPSVSPASVPPQLPPDFAERANAAYQKYMDMKQSEQRSRAVDQTF
jgi:hypothetical protein